MKLKRRSFLSLMALAAAAPMRAQKPAAAATVLLDQEIGRISPLIYGHFTEHIGRLIYEGVWVGADSKIPNRNGYRLDTLQSLERVRPPVFRWPGGCFGDTYHWEDGVGPIAQRIKRRNHWWLNEEPNTFGTDEFLQWCELLKAQPYLSLNVGSGSVSEALNWLEYCNGSGNSHYSAMRVRNGREKPYGVQWWGVGNENWGCGGLFTPSEYAQLFRQYGVYFKRMGLSVGNQLVGVGHDADDWNRKFLGALGAGLPYLDHLSVHRYFRRGHSVNFTDSDHIKLMLDLTAFENLITGAIGAIREVEAQRAKMPLFGPLKPKPIGLIIDEWGVWHEDAPIEDGFRQNGVLRDALFAASCLNLFHQYADRIAMTNIAQVINCLQSIILTDGAAMTLTPTFHVYELYQPHYGAMSVKVDMTKAPTLASGSESRPSLSISASKSGDVVFLTLVNQSPNEDADVDINFRGASPVKATAINLTGKSVRSQNTLGDPDAVSPKPWKAEITRSGLKAQVPARSVQAIKVSIKSS